MALTIPNTNRIRANADTTVMDAIDKTTQYINQNITPKAGTRVAAPTPGTRPIHPTPR